MSRRRLQARDYTIGWICAIPIELAAAQEMLNEDDEPPQYSSNYDVYTFGRIGDHNVVLACLPAGQMGPQSAAMVAARMTSKFTSIRFGLMVGIGGGVPSAESDIRLGDVVISQPYLQHGGVVQYDFGKTGAGGHKTRTGWLNAPPSVLLTAVSKLRALQYRGRSNFTSYLSAFDRLEHFSRDAAGQDRLFEANYNHIEGATCEQCSKEREVKRILRKGQNVVIHCGTIASGNQVIKDGIARDRISAGLDGVMCFEMEAAGLMNNFPCLVIRGICDYADSHKNKKWQPYAAATAAACAKEILSIIPAIQDSANETLPAQVTFDAPAVFEDAHGRKLPLQMQWIHKWEQFHEVLKWNFEGIPGLRKVELHEYVLQDFYLHMDIDSSRPIHESFRPGRMITMSMIFKLGNIVHAKCPKCHSPVKELSEEDTKCSQCGLWYRRYNVTEEVDELGDSLEQISQELTKTSMKEGPVRPHIRNSQDDTDSISEFARVRIMQTPSAYLPAGLIIEDMVVPEIMVMMRYMDRGIESQTEIVNAIQDMNVSQFPWGQSINVESIKLKRAVDKRRQMFETLREIIDRYNETAKSIIRSIER